MYSCTLPSREVRGRGRFTAHLGYLGSLQSTRYPLSCELVIAFRYILVFMADEITVADKTYISSKRASEASGYAQDYIGQLARRGQIDAQRIGGLWFVSLDSLLSYKFKASAFKPQPPAPRTQNEPGIIISLDGKDYVSAVRAAEITGYHQDYVGQLAREGKVLSRQVGNRWYVERAGILEHKKEKDALLAAVQAEAVGISRPAIMSTAANPESLTNIKYNGAGPYLKYTTEEDDLLPIAPQKYVQQENINISQVAESAHTHSVPIRVLKASFANISTDALIQSAGTPRGQKMSQKKGIRLPLLLPGVVVVATIVIVLSVGYTWLGEGAIYARINPLSNTAASGLADQAFGAISKAGDFLEELLVPELVFKRVNDDFSL